jgi:GGDEF domain-containing protein
MRVSAGERAITVTVPHHESNSAERGPGRLPAVASREELIDDLGEAVGPDRSPSLLAVFALEGLQEYNERYGGLAREELLAHLAARLVKTLGRKGRCYQPRIDEFAVLIEARIADALPLLRPLATQLCHHDRYAPVTVAFGATVLPDEAPDPVEALRLADTRLTSNAPRRKPRRRTIYHWNA